MEENTETQLYKVYKIGRKYGMSGRRKVLGRHLTLEEARSIVRRYPDSSRSMVLFVKETIAKKPTLQDKHPSFRCVCGHQAYWVARRGYHCFCNNPRKFNP